MTLMGDALTYRRLRAPRTSGGVLIDPPLSAAPEMLAATREERQQCDYDFQGRTFCELSSQARGELVQAALQYTREYRDVEHRAPTDRVFLAGHQPEIFHPGVWFKNFTLSSLARAHGAAAVNLVIDSDTIKNASLRVPGGTVADPRVGAVAFDRPTAEIPHEERSIIDRELFDTFDRRVSDRLRPLVDRPLVGHYWKLVRDRSRATSSLGECISQARHQLEGEWGQQTLELPQSRVCMLPSFHWFLAHLLANLPRLWEVYNSSVVEYRHLHRIRSIAHPVPELATEDDWLEAPLWVWTAEDPRRRRVFIQQRDDRLLLTDRGQVQFSLDLTAEGDAQRATEQLAELPARGIKLRTRALGTTLVARLLMGDLFLHGIGGAKYDQLTDLIISRFFGIQPPGFFAISATLHLPVERQRVTGEDLRHTSRNLRELEFHPEKHLDTSNGRGESTIADLIAAKRRWIATEPAPQNARQRAREIRRINADLQPYVASQRDALLHRREELSSRLRAEAILCSREYGFCLYPEDQLKQLMLGHEVNGEEPQMNADEHR